MKKLIQGSLGVLGVAAFLAFALSTNSFAQC